MSSLNPEEAGSQMLALDGSRIQAPVVCFRHSMETMRQVSKTNAAASNQHILHCAAKTMYT